MKKTAFKPWVIHGYPWKDVQKIESKQQTPSLPSGSSGWRYGNSKSTIDHQWITSCWSLTIWFLSIEFLAATHQGVFFWFSHTERTHALPCPAMAPLGRTRLGLDATSITAGSLTPRTCGWGSSGSLWRFGWCWMHVKAVNMDQTWNAFFFGDVKKLYLILVAWNDWNVDVHKKNTTKLLLEHIFTGPKGSEHGFLMVFEQPNLRSHTGEDRSN